MKERFEAAFATTMGVLAALLLYSMIVFIVGSGLFLLAMTIIGRGL